MPYFWRSRSGNGLSPMCCRHICKAISASDGGPPLSRTAPSSESCGLAPKPGVSLAIAGPDRMRKTLTSLRRLFLRLRPALNAQGWHVAEALIECLLGDRRIVEQARRHLRTGRADIGRLA